MPHTACCCVAYTDSKSAEKKCILVAAVVVAWRCISKLSTQEIGSKKRLNFLVLGIFFFFHFRAKAVGTRCLDRTLSTAKTGSNPRQLQQLSRQRYVKRAPWQTRVRRVPKKKKKKKKSSKYKKKYEARVGKKLMKR